MEVRKLAVDVVIIGGGIAGLWQLNRLRQLGYRVLLLEQDTLGQGQTVASQGMIHGGIKYALSGALNGSSEAVADMPERWRRCLRGDGDVDLRQAQVLSDHFYLWSSASVTSRMTTFFASKASRGRADKLKTHDYPSAFVDRRFRGSVYKLVDLVLDVPSLLHTLAAPHQDCCAQIDWQQAQWQQQADGRVRAIHWQLGDQRLELTAQSFILAAGAGNEALMHTLNIQHPQMQRRPLRQILVKHQHPHALYAHCMGHQATPRLTISSHRCADGQFAWYLGGDLATEGQDLSEGQHIDLARQELQQLFPWLDWQQADFATWSGDRAEPKQQKLIKPDNAFAEWAREASNVLVTWPTKLTLAPHLGDSVVQQLQARGLAPSPSTTDATHRWPELPRPALAKPPWDTQFG